MSSQREQTPNPRSSCDKDVKAEVMSANEKRKAEAELNQDPSPVRSPKIAKRSNTPTKQSSSQRKETPPSLFTPQPIVTIVLHHRDDPSYNETFHVHQNILCFYSQFFARKLETHEPNSKANPEPIILENVDPCTFGLFLNWIYYQKIRNEQGKLPKLVELAELWALGERIQNAALQNATMDHIRDEVLYPTEFESFIQFAYEEVEGQGNELRKLAIARLAWTLPDPFLEILGKLPGQAQMDLIMELKEQRDAVPKEHWRDIGAAEKFYVLGKEQNI